MSHHNHDSFNTALDISDDHIPPDPDDADCEHCVAPWCRQLNSSYTITGLPSQMHTSYPYGNPLKLTHPAALGTYPFGLGDAQLYSQLVYDSGAQGTQQPLRWDDFALDELLPVDPRKIEADKAARARKGATGAAQHSAAAPVARANPPPTEGEQGEGQGTGDTTGPTATSDGEDDDDVGVEESF
jgi:hypothetical protein